MSTLPEPIPPEPDFRRNGLAALDQRAAMRLLFTEPATRNYAFTALGAQALLFLLLYDQGSDAGGLLVLIMGLCGVLLRWSLAPMLILVIVTYFMWTPTGVPLEGFEDTRPLRAHGAGPEDFLLVVALVVYIVSQYRIFGLVHQILVFEGTNQDRDEKPLRRPVALISPTELVSLFAISLAAAVAGHLVWLFVTHFKVVPGEPFPLVSAGLQRSSSGLPPGLSRFYLLLGIIFFGAVILRVIFGYWRLKTLSREEAGMILFDTGWRETFRERVRLEKWRFWGRTRASSQQHRSESQQKVIERSS